MFGWFGRKKVNTDQIEIERGIEMFCSEYSEDGLEYEACRRGIEIAVSVRDIHFTPSMDREWIERECRAFASKSNIPDEKKDEVYWICRETAMQYLKELFV